MGRQSEGQLIFDRAHKEGSPEAFEMAFSRLKAERAWVAEERDRPGGADAGPSETVALRERQGVVLDILNHNDAAFHGGQSADPPTQPHQRPFLGELIR